MFAKAPRFSSRPISDVPGPGSYDVPIDFNLPNYKKGAMVEKSERWKEGEHDPNGVVGALGDGVGKENRPRSRVSSATVGMNLEKVRAQMDEQKNRIGLAHTKEIERLKAFHEKEVGRLNARIGTRDEKVKALEDDLRSTKDRLSKYTHQLPLLQSQLTELSTSNLKSREKKDQEITSLRSELREVRSKLDSVSSALDSREEEVTILRERDEERKEALHQLSLLPSLVSSLKYEHQQSLSSLVDQLQSTQLSSYATHKQLLDRSSQISALSSYASQVEEEVNFLREELKRTLEEKEKMRVMWMGAEEMLVGRNESEKEWRQRVRSSAREESRMKEEMRELEEALVTEKEWSALLSHESDHNKLEWQTTLTAQSSLLLDLTTDLEIIEGEYTLATTLEIPSLLSRIESLSDQLSSESDRANRTERSLRTLKGEYGIVEGELEELKIVVAKEKSGREKAEEGEKMWRRERELGRVKEKALEDDLRSANSANKEVQSLRDEQSEHLRTIDHLSRLNAALTLESTELSSLNTSLLSHSNANQRIRHVAQIRQDLVESRKKCLEVTSALKSVREENERLKMEREAWMPVGEGERKKVIRADGARLGLGRSTVAFVEPRSEEKETVQLSKSQPNLNWRFEENLSEIEDVFSQPLRTLDEDDEEEEVDLEMMRTSTVRKPNGGRKIVGRMRIEDLF